MAMCVRAMRTITATLEAEVQRTILTMGQVSEMIGRPLATLRYWRHDGDRRGPRSFRLGGRVVYDEADVHAWVDEQRALDEQRRAGAA